MSDLRGLSRGSKIAAFVILVVLLQVIVMSVLGLGAIARDREEGARLARESLERRASDLAEATLDRTARGMKDALEEVAKAVKESGGIRNILRSDWLKSFRDLWIVDEDGRVRASDGTPVFVPLDVIADERAKADPERVREAEQSLQSLQSLPAPDPALASARLRYVKEFPWQVEQETRYAKAVGEALALAKAVSEAPTPPLPVKDAVLLAWQTAAVNDGVPGAEFPAFAWVEGKLLRIVRALPPAERDPLLATLADLRQARDGLKDLREHVLSDAKAAARWGEAPTVFPLRNGQVVALASLRRGSGTRQALLVRLDRMAIADQAAAAVPASPGAEAGLKLRILQREAPLSEGAVALRRPLQTTRFDAALDAEVLISGEASQARAAGPNEAFYWTILALAALGVTVAGAVLVRILRREVHLARLKADFVSNLSHELKTPLTSISMFSEMLKDGSLEDEEQVKEGVAVIAAETERLQRIVSRMIDVARREAAAVPYDLVAGDVNAPIRAACDRFRRLERDPGLSLHVDLAPSLPPVSMDAGAIDDAVTNLLSNASKYRKGDSVRIRVATRPAGKGVEVEVTDDGVGIPRRDRKRVFEMFYRAENYLTRTVPGTGLGLALVRTIVRAHKGKVRVDEASGGGTTFRILLPASGPKPAAAPPPPAPKASPSLSPAPPRSPLPGGHR